MSVEVEQKKSGVEAKVANGDGWLVPVLKSYEDESGRVIVEGFVATSGFDLLRYAKNQPADKILRSAHEDLAECLKEYSTVLFNHNDDVPAGVVLEAEVRELPDAKSADDCGTWFKWAVSDADPRFPTWVKDGTLSKHSFRFIVPEGGAQIVYDESIKKNVRLVKHLVGLEASIVSVPMQGKAKVTKVTGKSADNMEDGMKDIVAIWAAGVAADAGDEAKSALAGLLAEKGIGALDAQAAAARGEVKGWGDVAMSYLWQLVDNLDGMSNFEELDESVRGGVAGCRDSLRAVLSGGGAKVAPSEKSSEEASAEEKPAEVVEESKPVAEAPAEAAAEPVAATPAEPVVDEAALEAKGFVKRAFLDESVKAAQDAAEAKSLALSAEAKSALDALRAEFDAKSLAASEESRKTLQVLSARIERVEKAAGVANSRADAAPQVTEKTAEAPKRRGLDPSMVGVR